MKIFVTPGLQGDASHTWEAEHIRSLARACQSTAHELVNAPEAADAILITDIEFRWSFLKLLFTNPVYRAFSHKCFLYHEKAVPFRIVPGLFTSMPNKRLNFDRFAAIGYSSHNSGIFNRYISSEFSSAPRNLFYSFMGRMSHRVRRKLLRSSSSRPDIVMEDTSYYDHWDLKARERDEHQKRYAEVLLHSRFALCPRGWATSSIRLYEAMQCGVVPVVISDDWRRPRGPDWDAFCVFIKESDVRHIDAILATHEPEWEQMAQRAHAEWKTWFAPDQEFHFLAESLLHVMRTERRELLGARLDSQVELLKMLAWSSVHYPATAVSLRLQQARAR